jgi:hypothetical protein
VRGFHVASDHSIDVVAMIAFPQALRGIPG